MNRIGLLSLLVALLVPATAYAGGWTQAAGDGYAKVWGSYLAGDAAYDADGDAVEVASFRLVRLHAYGEFGLRDDLTLVGSVQPLGSATLGDESVGFAGPAMVGLRQRFLSDGLQFAMEARIGGEPSTRDLAPADASYRFQPTEATGRFEYEAQVGHALPFGWITAAVGPRWHSSADLSHELFASAQLGFGPFAGFLFDIHLAANTTLSPLTSNNVIGSGDTHYIGGGLGVSYWPIDTVGFHAGADGALFARTNLGVPPLQLGVEFRF